MVQEVLKAAMDDTRRLWSEQAVRAVNQAFPDVEYDNWPLCGRLLPHALAIASRIERDRMEFAEAGRLLNQVAYYLFDRGQYAEAESLCKQALEIRRAALGERHPGYAASLDNLAGLFRETGRYAEAEPLCKQALEIRRAALGERHPDYAASLDGLAMLYRAMGRYAEAQLYDVRLLTPERVALGSELDVTIVVEPAGTEAGGGYRLEVPADQSSAAELNVFLSAPGFQVRGQNVGSLPLWPPPPDGAAPQHQRLRFSAMALLSGKATVTAELYRGATFVHALHAPVEVQAANVVPVPVAPRPRPVPQPDLILRVSTLWSEDRRSFRLQYHLSSFTQPLLGLFGAEYTSTSLASGWPRMVQRLLAQALDEVTGAPPGEGYARLVALGGFISRSALPDDLRHDLGRAGSGHSLLIVPDPDAELPWSLLSDGRQTLAEQFTLGLWPQEMDETRPYEFPLGQVSLAYYSGVDHPELWADLLTSRDGSGPPQVLAGGVFGPAEAERLRGLHLVRLGQSPGAGRGGDAPVRRDKAGDVAEEARPVKLSLRCNRPLVSLSYLRAGEPEPTALDQTWAPTYLRAGCSAFVGPLWAVRPEAAAFVGGLYNRLWAGEPLGVACNWGRRLVRAACPDTLDWLAYVLYGDPMARPYRPVASLGYAVVEPVGFALEEPVRPGTACRFRVSLRRTPPVWHQHRLVEVAEALPFPTLEARVVVSRLRVLPRDPARLTRTPDGDYLGWFTLTVPADAAPGPALVQVFLGDPAQPEEAAPLHSLRFSLKVGEAGGGARP
jgi:hypothetical protein